MISGESESAWKPFMTVAFTGTPGAKSSSIVAKCAPVSSSCHEPAMNTGTSIWSTNVSGASAARTVSSRATRLDPLADVGRLTPERLVGVAGLVAGRDAVAHPLRRRGLGIVLTVAAPSPRRSPC